MSDDIAEIAGKLCPLPPNFCGGCLHHTQCADAYKSLAVRAHLNRTTPDAD